MESSTSASTSSAPSVLPCPITTPNVPFAPIVGESSTQSVPAGFFRVTPTRRTQVESEEDEFSDEQENSDSEPIDIPDIPAFNVPSKPVQMRPCTLVRRRELKEETPVLNYWPEYHSVGCKNEKGGYVEEGCALRLYPDVDTHCSILLDVLKLFFRYNAKAIFALDNKDEYVHLWAKSLQNISALQSTPRFGDLNSFSSKDLCCKSQVDTIRNLLVTLHSNPITSAVIIKSVNRAFTDDKVLRFHRNLSAFIAQEYKKKGYEFFYFCFVNTKHPFHLATISALPLNAVTFEMCANKDSIQTTKKFDEKLKIITNKDSLHALISESHQWSNSRVVTPFGRDRLARVIRETAMKGVGISSISNLSKVEVNKKLAEVLNLSYFTGVAAHKNIIIPGLDIDIVDSETLKQLRNADNWEEYGMIKALKTTSGVSRHWLDFVFRKLLNTAWSIPRCVISKQNPEMLKYIYEGLLKLEYKQDSNWDITVLSSQYNPLKLNRSTDIKNEYVEWILDTEGFYTPVYRYGDEFKICKPFKCSLNNIRIMMINTNFIMNLKTEAILYMVSMCLGRGLTVLELNYERDVALGLLFKVAVYGGDNVVHECED